MVTNEFPTHSGQFYITSYGNGWAYQVEEVHTGRTLFFQDADACTLKQESCDFMDEGHIALLFEAVDYEAEPMCEFDVDNDNDNDNDVSREYWA